MTNQLFLRFASSSVSSSTLLKSSDQRRARTALIDAYPEIEEEIKEIFPKKGAMTVAKSYGTDRTLVSNCHPILTLLFTGPKRICFSMKRSAYGSFLTRARKIIFPLLELCICVR